jgi:hypothetical protein
VSYDLQIFARRRPKAADLDAFLAATGAATTDRPLKRGGSLVLSAGDDVHVEVDGPARIERDDVPDAANGAIGASSWLVQLSVKPSTDAAWPMDLSVHLARAAEGVVYDPQEDRVTWPAGFRPRDAASGEERIDEVELDWFVPYAEPDPEVPRRLLALLREHAPEAIPTRYGGYEPLPFRFAGDGAEGDFVQRWLEQATEWTPSLYWTATRPSFGGSAIMSTLLDPDRIRPGQPAVHISTSFDGRALARDPEVTERLVRLFTALATDLGCIYAAGSVQRDLLVKGGRISGDYRTEMSTLPRSDRWVGLPAGPTWLAWFGPPYAELVRQAVQGQITAEAGGALFVRMGAEPMNADDLAEVFPPLPAQLIARRIKQPATWLRGARFTLMGGPPSQPADLIPDHAGL